MKEAEIRNQAALDRYLELSEKDIKEFFDAKNFVKINCPACGGVNFNPEFRKSAFAYVSCKDCSTLFVNPRPAYTALKNFYAYAPSTDFWINELFAPVAEARREKIFRLRAEHISSVLKDKNGLWIGDIGAGFGIFLEELKSLLPGNVYVAIEPSPKMARMCRDKGFKKECSVLEEIKGMDNKFDMLAAFELVEHLFDPAVFVRKAYSLLKPGGYFYLTTLNAEGFDILLLWDKSKSVSPPHHLNFFNISSIGKLLVGAGFEIIEIITPGKLDWDIIENAVKNDSVKLDRFWEFLAKKASTHSKQELQDWITTNNLSSHMSIIARKPGWI